VSSGARPDQTQSSPPLGEHSRRAQASRVGERPGLAGEKLGANVVEGAGAQRLGLLEIEAEQVAAGVGPSRT
jgi:hypothetical protein